MEAPRGRLLHSIGFSEACLGDFNDIETVSPKAEREAEYMVGRGIRRQAARCTSRVPKRGKTTRNLTSHLDDGVKSVSWTRARAHHTRALTRRSRVGSQPYLMTTQCQRAKRAKRKTPICRPILMGLDHEGNWIIANMPRKHQIRLLFI